MDKTLIDRIRQAEAEANELVIKAQSEAGSIIEEAKKEAALLYENAILSAETKSKENLKKNESEVRKNLAIQSINDDIEVKALEYEALSRVEKVAAKITERIIGNGC